GVECDSYSKRVARKIRNKAIGKNELARSKGSPKTHATLSNNSLGIRRCPQIRQYRAYLGLLAPHLKCVHRHSFAAWASLDGGTGGCGVMCRTSVRNSPLKNHRANNGSMTSPKIATPKNMKMPFPPPMKT